MNGSLCRQRARNAPQWHWLALAGWPPHRTAGTAGAAPWPHARASSPCTAPGWTACSSPSLLHSDGGSHHITVLLRAKVLNTNDKAGTGRRIRSEGGEYDLRAKVLYTDDRAQNTICGRHAADCGDASHAQHVVLLGTNLMKGGHARCPAAAQPQMSDSQTSHRQSWVPVPARRP